MLRRIGALAALLVSFLAVACAAATPPPADSSWDPTRARGKTRQIDFTATEGTWMFLDVTPDLRWIVFDLLGHVYRVPITGGNAECLTQDSGVAINMQPRVSPDGHSIAFISDRKGQNNLWVMDADGRNPRPVLLDSAVRLRAPEWTPDGRFILAERTTRDSGRAIWMFSREGGRGTELVKAEPHAVPARPTLGSSGQTLFYETYTGGAEVAWGQDDILRGADQIASRDMSTGTVRMITSGVHQQGNRASSGGAYAQELSPDGRWLSFIRRMPGGTVSYKGHKFGPRSALWLRDLESGVERLLMDPVEFDLAETAILFDGIYPRYRWMPDGRSIVIIQGGKIRRVAVDTGNVTTIPFTAHVHRTISERPLPALSLDDGPIKARFLQWQSHSPDGHSLLFQAVGRIWIMDVRQRVPRRLTPASFAGLEYAPTWSPDGRWVAFVSWDDEKRGHLWKVDVASGGSPVQLTQRAGDYLNPVFSPDGAQLAVVNGAGVTATGRSMARNPSYSIVHLPSDGGALTHVIDLPAVELRSAPTRLFFGSDGRLFFTASVEGKEGAEAIAELVSVRLDGSDRRTHARIALTDDAAPSPDGSSVAFVQGGDVFLAPLPSASAGAVPTIKIRDGDFPVRRLSTAGGLTPRWRNATTLDFGSGPYAYSYDTVTGKTDRTKIELSVPRYVPSGSIALTGARLVTMDAAGVIEQGTVTVRGARLACIGSSERCPVDGIDRVIDVGGATILPGLIDMHAHHHREHGGILPAHNYETAVYLAYGVTTTLDPATASPEAFAGAELVEAGAMIGPRIFSTGEPLYAGDGIAHKDISSLEVAIQEATRRKEWGAVSLKQYSQPTRQQRQWVVEAGRRLGIRVTCEASADLSNKLTLAMDGHTGLEHATAIAPLYADVTAFLGQAGNVNSYTPLVAGFGAFNEEFYWQTEQSWKDPKLQRWLPWQQIVPNTRRYIERPVTDYSLGILAQGIADITQAGAYATIGSHGQMHGLGSHWDIWTTALAMPNIEALRVATLNGARSLGAERDLGSLTGGKLADLIVINGNPLEDIRRTTDLRYVMRAGILYDAASLDELWPSARKFGPYYWSVPEIYETDDKPVESWDRPVPRR